MKGLKITAIICAAILLVAGGAFAASANLPVYKAAHAPSIDGTLDAMWLNVPWNRDFKVVGDATKWEGWRDDALSFRILYDDNYLYVFVSANDDSLVNNSGSETWNDDSIELWIDGDNSKGAAFDGINDFGFQFLFNPLDSVNWVKRVTKSGNGLAGDFSGVLQAARRTALGLDLEVAIPISLLKINTAAGSLFGLEVDLNDDDDPAAKDTKLKYFSDQDESYRFPNTLGTAEIADRTVGEVLDVWYANTAPVIDGAADAMWDNVPEVSDNNIISGANLLDGWDDLSMNVKIAWDVTYLYYLITVKDDTLRTGTAGSGIPAYRKDWQSDCVELAIDGDNSRRSGYDQVNDRVFEIAYWDAVSVIDTLYQHDGTPTYSCIGVKQASALTADGFRLELAIPLDSLQIQPLNHYRFGHDADYDDNDTGVRDTKVKVYAAIDAAYNQPVLWGTAELLGGPVADFVPPVAAVIPTVPNATTVPTIDGKLDSAWVNVPPVSIANVVEGTPNDWWDSWAGYKMMWDKTNVYLFVTVHDDTVITTNADSTQNDGIVISMDGLNNKTADYDGKNDDAIRFVFNQAPMNLTPYSKNADVTKWTYAWLKTPTGYNLEVSMTVKLGLKFTPAANKLVGFDIQVNDNDTGARDGMLKWASSTAASPTPPSEMGTVQCVARKAGSVLDIPFTAYPLVIDGEADYAWGNAAPVAANYYMTDEKKRKGLDDVTLAWKTMWNLDYLFFLVYVKDDSLIKDSADYYRDDSIELWLDGDNSKKASYDGKNDRGFAFRYNPANPALFDTGTVSGAKFDKKLIRQAATRTADGFLLEVALPLADLGMAPGDGTAIGIDMDYNDDDNGADRDTKVKTYSAVDESWRYPNVFGTARFSGSNVVSGVETIAIAPRAFDLSQNYPNPFNPFTKINYSVPKPGLVKLAVYNVLGREVALLVNESKPAGTYTVNFDASRLMSGIYIYRIEAAGKVQSRKLMLLK